MNNLSVVNTLNNEESRLSLITIAAPILAVIISSPQTTTYSDIDLLRSKLTSLVQLFETQAKVSGYLQRTIAAARYCLCVAIDEAILSTDWGNQSCWAEKSLLAIVQKETWGGEKFYIIVEKMLKEPDVEIELLELFFVILNLGYEGKYFNNKTKLEDIKSKLFRTINNRKGNPELPFLSFRNPSNQVDTQSMSFWLIIAITTIMLLVITSLSETYTNILTKQNVAIISSQ